MASALTTPGAAENSPPLPGPLALAVLDHLGLRPDPPQVQALRHAARALARERGGSVESVLSRCLAEPPSSAQVFALAERLAVAESSFFRHPGHFLALERELLPQLRASGKQGVSVLSAGCARGEEPYSLAITLARAWPSGRHRVVGLDLSAAMISAAKEARFRPWSLRGTTADQLAPWFEPTPDGGVEGTEGLKAQVTFLQGTLLELPDALRRMAPFDIIFCRNVLIYFRAAAGRDVIARLAALLAPEGCLFVGPADHDFCADLAVHQLGGVHLYRLAQSPPSPLAPKALEPALTPPMLPQPSSEAPERGPAAPAQPFEGDYAAMLERGRAARDAGQPEDALRAFDQAIRLVPDRPEAFFEQAVLLDARGFEAAGRELLERALYLDACFAPALLVLSRVLMRGGHRVRARALLSTLDTALAELPPWSPLPSCQELQAGAVRASCRALLDRLAAGEEPR